MATTTQRSTADLLREVRKMPIYRQLVPMEAGVGWPLPQRKEGGVYITLPFFGMPTTGVKGHQPIYPPFALITLNWRTGRPVAYLDLKYRRPWPPVDGPVGHFPHEAIREMKRGDYLEKRAQLLGMYDEMLQMLIDGGTFDPDWTERFSALLTLLIEPPLLPYYRALAPKFIDRFVGQAAQAAAPDGDA